MKKVGLERAKELFLYSDSEPNEVLIALCHLIALPAALCVDFHNPSFLLMGVGISSGLFQLWAVLYNGSLRFRLLAVQIAALIALSTVINLFHMNLLNGSRVGWGVILIFAVWNCIRVFKEKLDRNG